MVLSGNKQFVDDHVRRDERRWPAGKQRPHLAVQWPACRYCDIISHTIGITAGYNEHTIDELFTFSCTCLSKCTTN